MISRNQVADIITTALATASDPIDASVFAGRLAIALDALGLIQFCDIAEPEAPIADTGAKTPGTEWFETRDRSR